MDSEVVFDKSYFDQYQYISVIGEGFDGRVHLFQHNETKERVALKCVANQAHSLNIQNEINIVRQLSHQHIIRYIGRSMDYSCLLMEYYPNGTLMNILKTRPLPMAIAKRIVRQLGEALSYIHNKQISHGDIKPQNILISSDYLVKLSDFGFARIIDQNTQQQAVGGSEGYTAPEVHNDQHFVPDLKKCDVFSLGVIFFNLATKYSPFIKNQPWLADNLWELIRKQDFQQYWELFGVKMPDGFRKTIEQTLHPQPDQRWSIQQLLDDPWMNDDVATCEQTQVDIQQRLSQ